MQSGEITVPAGVPFDPEVRLTLMDIAVDCLNNTTTLRSVRLKVPKTDQSRARVELYIGKTDNSLCPMVVMLRYLSVRGVNKWTPVQTTGRIPTHQAPACRSGQAGSN